MFLINITLNPAKIPADRADELLAQHRAWFDQHFESGDFLLLAPYLNRQNAGVIISKTMPRAELDALLAEDVYYPQALAEYEVREFKAVMAADNIHDLANAEA
ncbi:hypothetical protein CO608_04190 [Lysobacteraceae bacterium NML08-0793]|nr:hypothetical protein CO608_04190 [Xanthomonadaceae bacterium NML08-0793]